MVNEVKGAKVDADAAEEFECTIDNTVKDVTMSQSGCESHEDRLVTIDSGASVNVCSKWFGRSAVEQPDGSVGPRGVGGRILQDHGKRRIQLRNGNHLKRHAFHVVDVTQPNLCVIDLCENGIETHLARQRFVKHVERHEPLVKKKWCVLRQVADRSWSKGCSRGCDARQISAIFMCMS